MILFDQYAIKGTWDTEPDPADRTTILMPPVPLGVHGAGWHKSTQATLIALRQNLKPGQSFLDFGAGTGIVAVAAAKLGASKVYAAERDVRAIEFSKRVFEVNGVDVEFWNGDDPTPEVDFCIANVGQKASKLIEKGFLLAPLIIGIDGDGIAIHFVIDSEGGKTMNMQYMMPDTSELVLLRPDGEGMAIEDAAPQLVEYMQGPDIQAALDVQFGKGTVTIR